MERYRAWIPFPELFAKAATLAPPTWLQISSKIWDSLYLSSFSPLEMHATVSSGPPCFMSLSQIRHFVEKIAAACNSWNPEFQDAWGRLGTRHSYWQLISQDMSKVIEQMEFWLFQWNTNLIKSYPTLKTSMSDTSVWNICISVVPCERPIGTDCRKVSTRQDTSIGHICVSVKVGQGRQGGALSSPRSVEHYWLVIAFLVFVTHAVTLCHISATASFEHGLCFSLTNPLSSPQCPASRQRCRMF